MLHWEQTWLWLWRSTADMKGFSIVSAVQLVKTCFTPCVQLSLQHTLLLLILFPSDPPLWPVLMFAVMWWSWASVSPGPRLWPWSPASPKWVPSHSCSISNLSLSGWRQRTKRTMIFWGGLTTTGNLQIPVCPIHSCIYILWYLHTKINKSMCMWGKFSNLKAKCFLNSFRGKKKKAQLHTKAFILCFSCCGSQRNQSPAPLVWLMRSCWKDVYRLDWWDS